MATGDGWIRDSGGGSLKGPSHTVYLKKFNTFDPFLWGGPCLTIGDMTKSQGGSTPTTKLNTRMGGIMRDGGKLKEIPGPTALEISMKEYVGDRKAEDLETCNWIVDRRTQCRDADASMIWEQITRACDVDFSESTVTGSSITGEEESMVTLPGSGVYSHRIFRVTGEGDESAVSEAVYITDTDVSRPAGCPTCDDQSDCVAVAVSSLEAAATPYLFVNRSGGDLDQWGTGIALTGWAAANATCVKALGDFVVIGSNGESEIIYTDDLGTTQVRVTTNITGPNDLDAIDQTFIVGVEDAGLVIASRDAARTWEVLDNGVATAQNLNKVKIARDDPLTIYACGAANALIKTTNGGENWFALTGPSAGDALTSMYVKDKWNLLIGNDDGELWESTDGGITWAQQNALPDTPAAASLVALDGCGCDVMYAAMWDTAAAAHVVYRNVDGGASGKWYHAYTTKGTTTTYTAPSQDPIALVCCGSNRAILVGGETTTPLFYLLA